jgi:hypothetical protein
MNDGRPVYRSGIWKDESGVWRWHVEIDVKNGRSWHGPADSYIEAVSIVSQKLLDPEGWTEEPEKTSAETSAQKFVRVMEEYAKSAEKSWKTLSSTIAALEKTWMERE